MAQAKFYTAEEDLCITADRARVVLRGDPQAAFVLAGKGRRIPWALAERYGLTSGAAAVDVAEEPALEELTPAPKPAVLTSAQAPVRKPATRKPVARKAKVR